MEGKPERHFRRLESQSHLREYGEHHGDAPSLIDLTRRDQVPKFIIEREIPNAATLSAADLQRISQKSCGVLRELGPDIQWIQSFVTEDKITCLYIASNAELVREHA